MGETKLGNQNGGPLAAVAKHRVWQREREREREITHGERQRLIDWLTELKFIIQRYRVLRRTDIHSWSVLLTLALPPSNLEQMTVTERERETRERERERERFNAKSTTGGHGSGYQYSGDRATRSETERPVKRPKPRTLVPKSIECYRDVKLILYRETSVTETERDHGWGRPGRVPLHPHFPLKCMGCVTDI